MPWDAAMLARFGALDEWQPRPVVSQTLQSTKELVFARRDLVKDRVAALSRNHVHQAPLLKHRAAQRLRQVERQLAAIDGPLKTLCRADPTSRPASTSLSASPASARQPHWPCWSTCSNSARSTPSARRALPASLQSPAIRGHHSGKRFIRAERAHLRLRQAFFMPALVAIGFKRRSTRRGPPSRVEGWR